MEKKIRRKIIAYCILFTGLVAGITALLFPWFQKLADPVCQENMRQWILQMGVAGFFALLGLQILQVVIAFIPGEPVELLAGAMYGALGGLGVCLSGCVIASAIIFALSKRFGTKMLRALFGENNVQSWAWLQDSRKCDMVTFLLFFIPGTPKDMLTYIMGVTKMRLGKFLLISSFARIPSVLSSTIIGSALRQGKWEISLCVFLLTGLIGILGISFKERVVAFCRSRGKG